jgi:16S rRNA G1207 methylase RsmC
MQTTAFMIYKEVLEKRLARKKEQLAEIEKAMNSGNDIITAQDKRKYIELKAVVNELENCLDIAESMIKLEK